MQAGLGILDAWVANHRRRPSLAFRRRERQQRSKPIAEALAAWAEQIVRQLSRKSELAEAFRRGGVGEDPGGRDDGGKGRTSRSFREESMTPLGRGREFRGLAAAFTRRPLPAPGQACQTSRPGCRAVWPCRRVSADGAPNAQPVCDEQCPSRGLRNSTGPAPSGFAADSSLEGADSNPRSLSQRRSL